jgi:hypothetical protein
MNESTAAAWLIHALHKRYDKSSNGNAAGTFYYSDCVHYIVVSHIAVVATYYVQETSDPFRKE